MKKFALGAVRILIAVYLGAVLMLSFFQENLLFFPIVTSQDFKYSFLANTFSERVFRSGEHDVHSMLFHSKNPQGLILYFHGNAGSLENWAMVGEELAEKTGWNVWIVDYPGFGKSQGKISSEEQLHTLAKDFLTEAKKEFPNLKLIIYGRSIGSGLATKLAAENPADALVLESPFLNLVAMAKSIYPWAPMFLLKYKFMNDEYLPRVKMPITIIHGDRDEIVPYSQGRDLAKLNSNTHFVTIERGGHNNLSDTAAYWDALKGALPGSAPR